MTSGDNNRSGNPTGDQRLVRVGGGHLTVSAILADYEMPWAWPDDGSRTFLVRIRGRKELCGVVVAHSRAALFDILDEWVDPYSIEYFVLYPQEGFCFDKPSEAVCERIGPQKYWQRFTDDLPMDKQTIQVRAERRATELLAIEGEVDGLREMFNNIVRRSNARFNGYRGYSPKDADTMAAGGLGENHSPGSSGSHWDSSHGPRHTEGRNSGGPSSGRIGTARPVGDKKAKDNRSPSQLTTARHCDDRPAARTDGAVT